MGGLFTVLIIIACVGLILFVLVQNPKGGGLNSEFGSAVQLGGAKRATDILEKGTWGLAIGIALICLAMASPGEGSQNQSLETATDEVEQISDETGEENNNPTNNLNPLAPQN